ncbi:amino acid permease, partial [Acinetobacter baumannii]
NLNYKSFVDMAYDLIGPWAGFYVGWTYWVSWVLVGMADLTAVTSYLSFWLPNGVSFSPIEQAMISAGCVLFLLILNLLTVRLFGEVEFWFAIIKIVAIIALVLAGIYMVVT